MILLPLLITVLVTAATVSCCDMLWHQYKVAMYCLSCRWGDFEGTHSTVELARSRMTYWVRKPLQEVQQQANTCCCT
jgi:hypothetical protein